jgi:RLL motif-containing protein 1
MFKRKLKALNYHSPDSAIPLANTKDLKPLVVWLEDQKIRHYKMEERGSLREAEGERWVDAFKKYLKTLECPYAVETHPLSAVVDWLLGVALRYEFNEAAESNPNLRRGVGDREGAPQSSGLPRQLSQPEKSALDISADDQTFISGTQHLAKLLQITPHPDPCILLQAIRITIQEKLSESALNNSADSSTNAKQLDKKYTITAKECGFDLGDPALDEAAKVLRLLHIQELRDLQTRINELIVAVQDITADPKTDQSLGKVGR